MTAEHVRLSASLEAYVGQGVVLIRGDRVFRLNSRELVKLTQALPQPPARLAAPEGPS